MTGSRAAALASAAGWAVVLCAGACNATPAGDAGGDSGVMDASVPGCDPGLATDTCSTGGEACTPDYTSVSTTGFICQVPGPFFECIPEVGCAASNLQCVDAGAGSFICLQPCAATADCADPFTACGPLVAGGPSFCLLNECTDFWQPCSSESGDGGDGTCVFLEDDPKVGPIGLCLQAGPAAPNATCAYYRDAGAPECTGGTVCMVSGNLAQIGVCMTLCGDGLDGGPACGGTCVRAIPPAPPPPISAFDFFNPVGGCTSSCSSSEVKLSFSAPMPLLRMSGNPAFEAPPYLA